MYFLSLLKTVWLASDATIAICSGTIRCTVQFSDLGGYKTSGIFRSDLEAQVTQKAAVLTMADADALVLEPDGDYVGKSSLIASCNCSFLAL
jgi:hypothetical protein